MKPWKITLIVGGIIVPFAVALIAHFGNQPQQSATNTGNNTRIQQVSDSPGSTNINGDVIEESKPQIVDSEPLYPLNVKIGERFKQLFEVYVCNAKQETEIRILEVKNNTEYESISQIPVATSIQAKAPDADDIGHSCSSTTIYEVSFLTNEQIDDGDIQFTL